MRKRAHVDCSDWHRHHWRNHGLRTGLQRASVSVLERRGAAAEEASFANAGLVAPGYVTPWAAPGMPGKVLGHLLSRHAPVRVNLPLSGRDLTWMWKFYRACRLDTYLTYPSQLQRLAFYSRERLDQIRADLNLDYERSDGYMVLLRSVRDSKLVQPGLQVLREAGVNFKEIGPQDARRIEVALNPEITFHGAVHLPDDEVGNCRQFALLLKTESQRTGVEYLFNASVTHVTGVASGHGVEIGIGGENQTRQFDAVVICAGLDSVRLLEPLGWKVPMTAVHGYSISAAIREPLNAPASAVMDERYKVAVSRLGNRIRVAGSAELGGTVDKKGSSPLQTLYKVLHDWFPGAANLSSVVQERKGARPMLPEGPPIIGASGIAGVWLNLGHGSSG